MTESSKLWYDKPASEWNQALPVGNGRLGCMVHGRTGTELLCLNEDSVWYGGLQNRVPQDALKHLPKLRELVREGHHAQAEKLVNRAFCGSPSGQRHFEPLATVKVEFGHEADKVTDYRRELDLDTATHRMEYNYDGAKVNIEMLASVFDQVLCMRIQSSRELEFVVRLTRESEVEYESHEYLDSLETTSDRIVMLATPGGHQSIRACCVLGITTDQEGTVEAGGGSLVVFAKEALVVISARTSFRHHDFQTLAVGDVSAALERGAAKIWDCHTQHHQSLYRQTLLTLGPTSPEDALPTDQRIGKGTTPGLVALYTNYSRYLLLSSSRPSNGSDQTLDLPANLQGIWNPSFHSAWGSKFTLNINLQMNYWGCLPLSLAPCMDPLFSLLHRLALPENGGSVAKEMYGARGWCCHNNTDLWADCSPCERWMPATLWPLGGAWLSSFVWEHYLFSSSLSTLSKNFPVLEGAVEFCLDWLVPETFSDGKEYRVTNPSLSPENTFLDEHTGEKGVFCRGSTADLTIISSLFEDYLNACKTLQLRPHLLREVGKAMLALPPPSICKKTGRLQEWGIANHADAEPGHRHVSHLLGLYPFNCIDMDASPQLSRAALRSLEIRLANGGGHTGWSRSHLLCIFSRLRMPDKVAESFEALLNTSTLPNLFSSHPPFQIDGNFGAAAAVVECLVQSFELTGHGQRVLRILPCWPKEWGDGEVNGISCRGGWCVGFRWRNGMVEGCVEVRSVIEEDNTNQNGKEHNGSNGQQAPNAEERKGVVVFPDGRLVEFKGRGPHLCQVE
ncbi:glycoside hydrolase family 95 protein, partial [Aureobasidium melanogenum]